MQFSGSQCRGCGSSRLKLLGVCSPIASAKYISTGPGNLLKCVDCALVQRDVVPTYDELLSMYRAEPIDYLEYKSEENLAWANAKRFLEKEFSKEVRVKVLDVGCHTGGFLGSLPPFFEKFGIEANGEPARVARKVNGVRLIGERIESISPEFLGGFDVVSLFDVLEHLPDPTHGIDVAAKLLKPSGLLIFSTGDADAWTWRHLGSDHWYLQTAQHLGVLSKTYVERLARNRNWSIQRLDSISHTRGSLSKRLYESIQLLHWSARGRRGLWRVWRRLLQEIPGCGDIRHRRSVPWTMTLKDHMIVGIRIQ